MKFEITPERLNLIKKAIGTERGGQRSFALKCGVPESYISNILNGKKKKVLDDLWQRLCIVVPELAKTGVNVYASNIGSPFAQVQISGGDVETFRRKVLDAIMQSDLTPDAKEKVYNLVREVK